MTPTTTIPVTFDLAVVQAEVAPIKAGLGVLQLATARFTAIAPEDWDEDIAKEALTIRNEAATRFKNITDKFEPIRKTAANLKDMIVQLRDEAADPFKAIKDTLDESSKAYLRLQLQAKRDAENKIGKAADRERDSLLTQADDLMAKGFVDQAESLKRQAEMTVAPELPGAIPTFAGTSVTQKWTAEPSDLMLFIKAVAEGKVPLMHPYQGRKGYTGPSERPILIVDQSVLSQVVGRLGDGLKWPGIKVEEDVSLRSRKL